MSMGGWVGGGSIGLLPQAFSDLKTATLKQSKQKIPCPCSQIMNTSFGVNCMMSLFIIYAKLIMQIKV